MGSQYPTSPTATAASRAALGLSESAEFASIFNKPFTPSMGNVSSEFQSLLRSTASYVSHPSFGTPASAMGRYTLPSGGGFPSMAAPSLPRTSRGMAAPAGSLLGFTGRAIARLMPWMSAALTAYDLYDSLSNADKELGPYPSWANREWQHPPEAVNLTSCGPEEFGPMDFGVASCGSFVGYCCSPIPGHQPPPPGASFDNYGVRREGDLFSYWMVEYDSSAGAEPNVAQHYKLTSRYGGTSSRASDELWPRRQAGILAGPAPEVHPQVDPMSSPVSGAQPRPAPIPWFLLPERRPNPMREEQSESGSEEPAKDRRRAPWKHPFPFPVPPDAPPSVPPGLPRPPGKGVKEVKLSSSQVKLLKWAFQATEVNDFIEGLYDALPKHCQDANRSVMGTGGKSASVYRCFDEIDWEQAAVNLVLNQVEDALIGAGMGQVKAINEAISAVLGFDVHIGRGIAM